MSFTDNASKTQSHDCSKLVINQKNNNDVTIYQHEVFVKIFWRCCFLLSSLVTGQSFMLVSLLVLELWQFSLIKDWSEIQQSEIHPSEFCPISGDWGNLGIPGLIEMLLMNCYWMLQNTRVTAFMVFELSRETQQGMGWKGVGVITPHPPRSGLNLP